MVTRAELAAQLAAMEKDTVLPVTTKILDGYAALDAALVELMPADGGAGTGVYAELSIVKKNLEGYRGSIQAIHNRYTGINTP